MCKLEEGWKEWSLGVGILFTFTFGVFLAGCNNDEKPYVEPKVSVQQPDESYTVRQLFDVEGCKMFRFYDKGEWRYFAKCTNSLSVDGSVRKTSGKVTRRESHTTSEGLE